MPLNPDEIDPEVLPRASVGGYKSGPVKQLLKRVAWDYRQLLHDNHQLRGQLAELEVRACELERQLERFERESRRKQPDELARQALAASQRAARELRESTREACEIAIKKARTRADRSRRAVIRTHLRRSMPSSCAGSIRLKSEQTARNKGQRGSRASALVFDSSRAATEPDY